MKKTDLQWIRFGQRYKDFNFKDFELVQKIKRLATQHQKQCENDCNGYGVVRGQSYYTGKVDDYARREYGSNVKSGYVAEDITIFYQEIGGIEVKIKALIARNAKFTVEFQHDPRGNTVKLYYDGDFISL